MATGKLQKPIKWVGYTATSDSWGQIIIPANVLSPTEKVVAVKTVGCYSTPVALNDTQTNWVLTVLKNANAQLTPWAGLLTYIEIGVM